VNKLTSGLDKIQIESSWGGVVTEAQPGKPMGVIKATDYYRDDQGRIVVDEDGFPQTADNPSNQGNITPDWTAGMTNTFSYKGLNLSVLVDGRKGGDFFSVTKMFGLYAGVLDETAKGDTRINGIIGGKNIYTDETWVKEDGSVNDIAVDPQSFWSRYYGVKAASVIDGSYIKLREISLGYTLPETILPGFLQRATLSAYVHNAAILWMHESNDIPIDPETSYGATLEGQGFEQFQLPPNRSIGLKVDLKF
jgi:hypothetical protein